MRELKDTDWKKFFLSPEGRVSRAEYWLKFALPYSGLAIVLGIIDAIIGHPILRTALSLLGLIPILMVAIKRCHDRDKSGWFLLVGLIPLVNFWLLVELWFLGSTPGANRFGPPLE